MKRGINTLGKPGTNHQVLEIRSVEGRARPWPCVTMLRDLDLLRWATENPLSHLILLLPFMSCVPTFNCTFIHILTEWLVIMHQTQC